MKNSLILLFLISFSKSIYADITLGYIAINDIAECTGPDPDQNVDFQDWYVSQSSQIMTAATTDCGGVIMISDDYSAVNWVMTSSCESEVTITWTLTDNCGSSSVTTFATFTIESDELIWLNPNENLPNDIEITLSELECSMPYYFTNCEWTEDITNPNSITWPNPSTFMEGVHYQGGCGNVVFTYSHQPCPIVLSNGNILVTYTLENGCGSTLIYQFSVIPNCANCSGSNGVFCPICADAIPDGCFTCNVNDLLNGFSSCTPPYEGGVQGPPQPTTLCNGQGVPNNMSWFAFVAGSPELSIEVCPSDCIPSGGSIGIQAGIYESCDGECIAGDGSCPNTLQCKDFALSDMIVGNTYYLFVDGCNGAECNYDITIEGQEAYILDDMESVTIDTECSSTIDGGYCSGQEVRFNVLHDGSSPTDNGQYDPPGSYDPELDLCYTWSAFPIIDGLSDMTFSQISNGGQGTPPITLPTVTEITSYEICIEDIYGPCDDPCDDADCVGDCCVTITVLPPAECFVSDSCTITNLVVQTTPCTADSLYNLNFEFDYNSPNCNGFTAMSNGVLLGNFTYGQNSYSVGPYSCGEIEELIITDNINNCNATIAVPVSDCCTGNTCMITDLASITLPCNSAGTYFVDFTFVVENPGQDGFIVRGNGNDYGAFDYGGSSYRIGPFENCGDIEELIIIDNNFSSCTANAIVDIPDCCIGSDTCSITSLVAETLPCSPDSVYFVDFNFDVNNPGNSGFTARGNGNVFGSFDYGGSLYRIGPFDSCDEINELVIIDNEDNTCNTAIAITPPDCCVETEVCSITGLAAETLPCSPDSVYFVDFNFDVTHPGGSGFTARGNGTVFGSFDYGASIYRIGPFDSCDEINELVIIDNEDNTCNVAIAITPPDCCAETEECTIENLVILNYNITSDSFLQVTFDFAPMGTSEVGIDIFINGVFHSFSNYMDIPYDIIIDEFDPNEPITIEICDNDNPDCCNNVTLNLEDPSLCTFQNLEVIQTECIDNSYFYIINFLYPLDQDTTQLEMSGNGNNYGTFSLEDIPITIGPFDVSEIINELNINIIDQIDCNISVELDPMCDITDSNDDILSKNIRIKLLRNVIAINSNLDVASECYLFNIGGQIIHHSEFKDILNVPTHDYGTGIYFIHIRNSEGYLTTKVFINN